MQPKARQLLATLHTKQTAPRHTNLNGDMVGDGSRFFFFFFFRVVMVAAGEATSLPQAMTMVHGFSMESVGVH